uniref:DUF5641 domain-containing protein n=1 Tax=Wuchereria bancrofti TaxID=6293 RepID=A0AAF5PLG9_WUCBA
MWKLLRIKDIKIDEDGKVRNVQVETLTGKLLDRPINVLYPLEVNDGEIHLEPNKKENMKIRETEQKTEKLQEFTAMRTRSNTKRQSRSKEVNVYTRSPITVPAIKCSNITRTVCTKAFLWFSLSVISDQTTTTAPSSETCRDLHDTKKLKKWLASGVSLKSEKL